MVMASAMCTMETRVGFIVAFSGEWWSPIASTNSSGKFHFIDIFSHNWAWLNPNISSSAYKKGIFEYSTLLIIAWYSFST